MMTNEMPEIKVPNIPDRTYRITDFGAVADGITLNTEAINRAIEQCAAQGGGKVVIPAGTWLTGPIHLKNNIELHAESGALVVFSKDPRHYPLIETMWEGNQAIRSTSPINGVNLENIAITGEGIFDGNGDAWRPVKRFKMTDKQWNALLQSGGAVEQTKETEIWWPNEGALQGGKAVAALQKSEATQISDYEPYRTYLRPVMLNLRHSKIIRLEGATFQNSPAWNLHLYDCEHITMRRVAVRNPWYAQNGDGLDLESSRYAIVEDCTFDVGDDAICMKSGKNEEGRRFGKPVECVIVRNCTVFHGHGGFVVGSEMSGGARNIVVENCSFIGTDVGLRFKSTRGRGGVVENIVIRGIQMKDIAGPAISFNLFYGLSQEQAQPVPVSEETPEFRNIMVENVSCAGAKQAIEIKGLPELPVNRIFMDGVTIEADRGVTVWNAKDIVFKNTKIVAKEGETWNVSESENIQLP
ncbi:glycoside hydrolase family 28 protein [Paenibacillus turpanensis]|uniref:glycoside hydrolase family 28 protein n=1 Tax=Paenibacillus turpanensis TaxID=2689078 RepID=UPI00140C10A5|nr:glycoside hydrolase family 28 protein [Paenibacillus turpanensis]